MTREEAKTILKNAAWLGTHEDRDKVEQAVDMAIQALLQEPTVQDKQAESEKYQKAFDDGYANGYAQARFDYEQEPCDVSVSEKEPNEITEEVTLRFFKNSLKVRWHDFVIYNVEWLKRHWQMEMDIVCGVKPCDDAISREAVIDTLQYAWEANKDIQESIVEIKALPSVTQKSGKWIPVSERLPEDAQEVLYSTKTGRVFHGEYYDDNTDRKWFSYKDDMFSFNNVVTAWMPLPKPYEPQESEG